MSPRQRLDMGDAVRKLLEEQPAITIRELCKLTGAPPPLVQLVRRRYRAWKEGRP